MDPDLSLRVWLVLALLACSMSARADSVPLVLTNATIHTQPFAAPIQNGTVVVRGSRIAAVGPSESIDIPPDAHLIDCRDKTITAGYWNSHVHFLQRKWARASDTSAAVLTTQLANMFTRHGFTTVIDAWSNHGNTQALRKRVNAGEVHGPRILTAGAPIYGPGDPPANVAAIWEALGFFSLDAIGIDRVATKADVEAAVVRRIERGVDFIKLYATSPGRGSFRIGEPLLKIAVESAAQVPVLIHPSVESALVAAVSAGADVIMHTTPQSGLWQPATVALMKAHDVALVPTLSLWPYEMRHERADVAERFAREAVNQLSAWVAAEGVVLFGTDVGYMADDDPAKEYALMAQANMSPAEILASLTTNPASRLGNADESGAIEVGARADLTVLGGPIDSALGFTDVRIVIQRGAVIYTRDD